MRLLIIFIVAIGEVLHLTLKLKFILAGILMLAAAFATCDPPNYGGDWTILATENCGNHSIELNITGDVLVYGNLSLNNTLFWVNDDLIVYAGGNISFDNSTIRMNGTAHGGATIDIRSGGRFNVTNGTMIENGVVNVEYNFDFDDGSYGFINDSTIKETCDGTGGDGTCTDDGLSIKDSGGNVVVENCTFTDLIGRTAISLTATSANIRIFNNTITDGSGASTHGIYCGGSGHTIASNYIYAGSSYAIYLPGNTVNLSDNELIRGNGWRTMRVSSTSNSIVNNTIFYGSLGQITLEMDAAATGSYIHNNTITAAANNDVVIGSNLAYSTLSNNVITGRFYGVGDNIIENNTITGNSAWITVSLTGNNNNITNNTIINGWNTLRLGGDNNRVINNTATGAGSGQSFWIGGNQNYIWNNTFPNVYLDSSTDNTIANNTMAGSSYGSVWLTASSDDNNITNNTVSRVIYSAANDNIRIENNTISSNDHGVQLAAGATNVYILRNNFTTCTRSAINLNATTNAIIDSNNFENNGASFEYSSYASLSDAVDIVNNNTFQGNDANTFIFNSSSGTIENLTLPATTTWNATLGGNSQVTFINVSHVKNAINVSGSAVFIARWYLNVTVYDELGNAFSNVLVTAYDTNSNAHNTGITNSSGQTVITVTDYNQTSTTVNDFDPYTATGTYTGYSPISSGSTYMNSNNATVINMEKLFTGGGNGGTVKKRPIENPLAPTIILTVSPGGKIAKTAVTLKIETSKHVECRYSPDTTKYTLMTPFKVTNDTTHYAPVTAVIGRNTYFVLCENPDGSIMENPEIISFIVVADTVEIGGASSTTKAIVGGCPEGFLWDSQQQVCTKLIGIELDPDFIQDRFDPGQQKFIIIKVKNNYDEPTFVKLEPDVAWAIVQQGELKMEPGEEKEFTVGIAAGFEEKISEGELLLYIDGEYMGSLPMVMEVIVLNEWERNMRLLIGTSYTDMLKFMEDKPFGLSNGKYILIFFIIVGLLGFFKEKKKHKRDIRWIYGSLILCIALLVLFPSIILSW